MSKSTPSVRDLARLLLALEAAGGERTEEKVNAALSVFEKLRVHLSKLVGSTGFQVLLSRAAALARKEVEWLEVIRIEADVTLEGFREAALQQPAKKVTEGCTALLAQLLGLLFTFIGEALTLRLVWEVWPEVQPEDKSIGAEETLV